MDVTANFCKGLNDVIKSFLLTKGDEFFAVYLLDGFCHFIEFARICCTVRQRVGNRRGPKVRVRKRQVQYAVL